MIATLNQYLATTLILTTASLWIWTMLTLPDKRKQDNSVINDNNRHGGDL